MTEQGGIRQIVLLAAGLDTRAFRLEWAAGTVVFEVDQAAVLDHKESVLAAAAAAPVCERRVVKADLTGEWIQALVEAGFDSQQPSGWLLEGFLFYLPTDAGVRILDEVSVVAAPGSWIGFDVINSLIVELNVAPRALRAHALKDIRTASEARGPRQLPGFRNSARKKH